MSNEEIKTQLDRQKDYVKQERIQRMQSYVKDKKGGASGLFDPELTIKTFRSVRYESEAHAGADIIDNAIEAGASQVHVVANITKGKITDIAFIDDGSGIASTFLPWAVSWGGSAQHGDVGKRNTFGRFGFGLPTASINRGTAYDVISRYFDESTGAVTDFAMVTVDIKHLERGPDGLPVQPQVKPGKLPAWVVAYVADKDSLFRGGLEAVRTVVIWRDLDRLNSKTIDALNPLLLNHFGVTYAGWLPQCSIYVNGIAVEPIDVLFTSPNARYFDVEGTRAEDHGKQVFMMKGEDGTEHPVTVRLSKIGLDAYQARLHGGRGQPPRIRERIRKQYNGFFVTRRDRFIELWKPSDVSWQSYMRQVAVHLDFPPELDEMFGVTPDKQTINPRPQVIDTLNGKGVLRAMRDLYNEVNAERQKRKAEDEGNLEGGVRVSEVVMDKVSGIINRPITSAEEKLKRQDEAKKNLERKVKEVAAVSAIPEATVREELTEQTSRKRFHVELVSLGENGVFINPEQRGLQTVLQINIDHLFFKDVYSKISPEQFELRSGLELLLFTLALGELDAIGEKAAFYLNERIRWGQLLSTQIHVQSDVISNSDLGAFTGDYDASTQEDE